MSEVQIKHLNPHAQPTETWIAICDGNIVGHIYMQKEADNKIKFLDAFVHSDYRRRGIYRQLWDIRWEYVNKKYRGWKIYAWCKDGTLPLLIERGFSTGEICTYVEYIIK